MCLLEVSKFKGETNLIEVLSSFPTSRVEAIKKLSRKQWNERINFQVRYDQHLREMKPK